MWPGLPGGTGGPSPAGSLLYPLPRQAMEASTVAFCSSLEVSSTVVAIRRAVQMRSLTVGRRGCGLGRQVTARLACLSCKVCGGGGVLGSFLGVSVGCRCNVVAERGVLGEGFARGGWWLVQRQSAHAPKISAPRAKQNTVTSTGSALLEGPKQVRGAELADAVEAAKTRALTAVDGVGPPPPRAALGSAEIVAEAVGGDAGFFCLEVGMIGMVIIRVVSSSS